MNIEIRYHQRKEQAQEGMKREVGCESDSEYEDFSTTLSTCAYERWKKRVWNAMEKPRSSKVARVRIIEYELSSVMNIN